MAKNVEFIGFYDEAMPREHFIQQIPQMLYVQFTGHTFGDFAKAIEEKYKNDETLWPLFEDFLNFNREDGGAEDSSVLFSPDGSKTVAHFVLYNK